MSEDMSEIFQKMNEMLKNNQIPEEIQSMMNNFTSNSSKKDDVSSSENSNSNAREKGSSENNEFEMPNFDMGTMLKMKSIIDTMNKEKNDPRSNLLKSLKPYLKPSRKEKVDQYIKLFSMGKVFEVLNPLGGDKKNDV